MPSCGVTPAACPASFPLLRSVPPAAPRLGETVLASLAAALLSFAMGWSQLVQAWRDGAFFDTDDAMHMVQARALIAGQGWFDMAVPRLDPPAGTVMHWSRLADLPVVALIRLFGGMADGATAERLACLCYSALLTLALFLAIARLARVALGVEAVVPAIVAVLLSGIAALQFTPGRIDHHAPQVLILILALASVLDGLGSGSKPGRRALPAGLLVGLSLAINLEDMPFLATLGAGLVAMWVLRPAAARGALLWFASGVAVGLPLAYAAITAPSRYGEAVCDAFGLAHLGAGTIAAAGLALAAAAPLRRPLLRAAAALAAGAAALAFVALASPSCLGNPFGAVDPLVRQLWLAEVAESLPLATLLRHDTATAFASALPVALGLAGCIAAALRGPPERRRRFALVALVVGAGLALSFWQVRVLSSVGAIAALGAAHLVLAARRICLARGAPALASLSLVLLLPFTGTAAALVAPSPPDGKGGEAESCTAPAAFAPLTSFHGRVDAPLDAGSFLLVHTSLDPYAAAFHRDNDGNRFHFDLAMAGPAEAERIARSRPLDLILLCPGWAETRHLARRAPASFAAALSAGRIPPWLEAVPLAGTPIRAFRLRPAAAP